MQWTKISDWMPPEGVVVNTKIDNQNGVRNEQKLIRHGRLYFHEDGKTYVYYTPTHWQHTQNTKQ